MAFRKYEMYVLQKLVGMGCLKSHEKSDFFYRKLAKKKKLKKCIKSQEYVIRNVIYWF